MFPFSYGTTVVSISSPMVVVLFSQESSRFSVPLFIKVLIQRNCSGLLLPLCACGSPISCGSRRHSLYRLSQVYLEELHALLARRFGRCQPSGRGSFGGRNASRCTTAANVCGVNETSSASAKVTTAATMGATASSLSSSCAALERVRRKLLVGEGGLGRLKAALFSVGGGDGGGRGVGERGTLTKVRATPRYTDGSSSWMCKLCCAGHK